MPGAVRGMVWGGGRWAGGGGLGVVSACESRGNGKFLTFPFFPADVCPN
ncbi:hypothetical protein HMPREF1548_03728, partial [Clostridium sp. KLE 1755]